MPDFWVNGIVSHRNKKPYIQLSNEHGMIAQLSMTEARQIAADIMLMASRTEADALLLAFVDQMELGRDVANLMMVQFRDFRADIDNEKAERSTDGEG